jgi:hypothetical protein
MIYTNLYSYIEIIINRISNRHSRLVEDTTALEKMYVEGTLAKLLVTSGNGELRGLIIT